MKTSHYCNIHQEAECLGTVDTLAHRMGNLCACGIEGIIYIEPHYRSIICAPVSFGSAVVREKPVLAWVISHSGSGMVVLSEIGISPSSSASAGLWLKLSNRPSTNVDDIKTTDADAVSPVSTPVYTSIDVLCVLCVVWRTSQPRIP